MNAALEDHLAQLRVAFANIVVVAAAAARLDVCQIGYPNLSRSLKQALAVRRAW